MKKTAILTGLTLALLCPITSAQTASLDELLAQVAKWDFDDKAREPLIAVEDAVVKAHGSAARTREIEDRFIALLKSGATYGGKDFVCRQLSVMGSEASVPVLSGMLLEPKTADIALYALERIPGRAVDRALRDALPKTSGRPRIGVIHVLGRRGDPASVAALRPLASGQEAATAAAALFALAEIADPAALEILAQARHPAAAEAYLRAADRLGSAAIYRKLYAPGQPPMVRVRALHGLATTAYAQSVPLLMEALRAEDARLQAVAIRALAQKSPAQLAGEIPKLTEGGRVRALGVLAERGDASVLPAFVAALKDPSQPVRVAALQGMANVGNASVASALARVAAGGDEAEQAAARAALAGMRGQEVDRAVIDGIASAEPKLKLELIRAAGERGSAGAAPALLKMARDATDEVRRESLRALRDTGSANDVAGLVALVVSPAQAGDRAEAARSLAAVLRRTDGSRIREVVSAYTPASDREGRAALLQVMGQSGNAEALPILRAALNDTDAELKRAAIVGLSDWPDATPVGDLLETARTASTLAHQVLAVRGAVRLIALPAPRRAAAETVRLLADAMSLAKQADERRAVLALLPKFPVKEALDLARAWANDSEVGAEAAKAAAGLERLLNR